VEKDFEILPHKADLQIRAYGKTRELVFKNMLRGMFLALEPQGEYFESGVTQKLPEKRRFEVESHDLELLLVDFLSEALYCSDVYCEAYLDLVVEEMTDRSIKGFFKVVPITGFTGGEVKAVTHHDLKVEKTDGGYVAQVLFDL